LSSEGENGLFVANHGLCGAASNTLAVFSFDIHLTVYEPTAPLSDLLRLKGLTTISALASTVAVSEPMPADIRAGRHCPYPRHWQALAKLVGVVGDGSNK
jgi:hypothetical protein